MSVAQCLDLKCYAFLYDHNAWHMHHHHQIFNWSRVEWYLVLFLDENSFNLTITDEQKHCWRHQEECYTPIAKSPDGHLGVVGVMVWKSSLLASELISTKWIALWKSSTSSVTSLAPLSYPCISYTCLNSSSWLTSPVKLNYLVSYYTILQLWLLSDSIWTKNNEPSRL